MSKVAKSVDEYMATVPELPRATLEKLRSMIRAAVPEAEETISYQMPTFKYKGRFLVSVAAFKKHCSLFPLSGSVLEELGPELEGYDQSGKGTLRFPHDMPLPAALVKKIVKIRVREIEST